MIPVEEARARILKALRPMPAEQVGLTEAFGRVLAEDIAARVSAPPTAVSAMDGYAVRATDVQETPAKLRVVVEIPAGQSSARIIGTGEAARIFTGAPLPEGADTIVIQEDTEREGDTVTVKESAEHGAFVRPAGLDFAVGDVLLREGRVLTARDVGLAAAMNRPWLMVSRRPRVALLATGDEIVLPGDPVSETRIISSNTFALAAMVRASGGEPNVLGIAGDSAESLRRLVGAAEGADILVTTGGASVGEHDIVQAVLGELGLSLDFWRIAMRPGKPLMFGQLGPTPMLGFPGNPVSSMVCAVLFLRPALQRMLGATGPVEDEKAVLAGPLRANDRRQDYLRATLQRTDSGELRVQTFARQDSSMFATLARSDCLVVRAPHAPAAAVGDRVTIIRLGGGDQSI